MSDDNARDRPGSTRGGAKATQLGAVAGKQVKRGAAARTIMGLPVMDPARAQRIARAGLSGRPPVGGAARPGVPADTAPTLPPAPPPANQKDLADSDTRYMEPPSEALGRAPTEVVAQAEPPIRAEPPFRHEPSFPSEQPFSMSPYPPPPAAVAPMPPREPEPAAAGGLFGSTLQRAHAPTARSLEPPPASPAGAGLFSTSLSAMHDPEAPKPPAPRTSFNNNQAPEAWRDDVRRMAERGPAPPPRPKVQPGPTASLRLKLDADPFEEQPYRAPKSALPKVLTWLVVLGLIGGGAAYYVQGHGGLGVVLDRLRGVEHPSVTATPPPEGAQPGAQPTAANPVQPGAAAQPAQQPQQPAAAAQPTAAQPTAAQPTAAQPAATAPNQGAQPTAADESARQLADPDAPKEQPAAATPQQPAAAAPTQKPAAAPSSAAPAKKPESKPKAAAKAPARRHEPVVKVRPLDNGNSAPSVDLPPAPADMPFVPAPAEPPAPDEPR